MNELSIITPDPSGIKELDRYFSENKVSVHKLLKEKGAILFRGFAIGSPTDFAKVAKVYSPNLASDYYGTSPRTKISNDDPVFTASEIPPFFPLIQHCEMSFIKVNPDYIYFFCQHPPETNGETPLCDVRKIHDQMDPRIREEFQKKKIMTIRHYNKERKKFFNSPFALKTWKEMFGQVDKKVIEDVCREIDVEVEWEEDEILRLITRNEPFLQSAWHNHALVFHELSVLLETQRIFKLRPSLSSWITLMMARMLFLLKRLCPSRFPPMDAKFGDGSNIPDEYIRHIHDLVWKNQIIFSWQKGDMVLIDNKTVSHGRLPYKGKRTILVAWQ